MSLFQGPEKGVSIRQASTANLMLDSQDRDDRLGQVTAGNFTIQKKNSILNGYFTRIATTEVVLDWGLPNVYDMSGGVNPSSAGFGDAPVRVDISGVGIRTASVRAGSYTVSQALDSLVVALNVAATPAVFSIVTSTPGSVVLSSTVAYRFPDTAPNQDTGLANRLGFLLAGSYVTTKTLFPYSMSLAAQTADLRVYKYLDFISTQLTYNQELKDSSTNTDVRDTLCRWYMSVDNIANYRDTYGFPIYLEYTPFSISKLYPFPKQIKWDPTMPVGQLQFQVFATTLASSGGFSVIPGETYLLDVNRFEWRMTLQVSEV